MKVPFLDLRAHHAPLRAEFLAAIAGVIDTGAFAGGPFVARFEQEFAAYCGTREAVGVGNGTDALWLALLALGVGPGDEVLTVPMTFMATAEAITYCGAQPVFVDIDDLTYTMDPTRLEAAITPRTKAIIPVHLLGQCADMDPILEIAKRHDIPVVEDACQAHGASYKGRRAGNLGVAGCFSFYPGKNLGAFGEAGAITTNDNALADRIRMFRDHGQARKYHHDVVGWNARMDGIQAAVLQLKLPHLDPNNDLRRAHAAQYAELLADIPGLRTPLESPHGRHVYHVYALRVPDRDRILNDLQQRGIGCGIHYPIPVHLQQAYASLSHARGAFPIAERCAGEFLSLPMFPELTEDQVAAVAQAVTEVAGAAVGSGG
jgi:dTDP-4-amino-4,6-dideoxygalactose transaminase